MQADLFSRTGGLTPPWPHRVLLVTAPFIPSVGGVQNVVHSLAGALSGRGHEVTVMTAESSIAAEQSTYRVVRRPCASRVWREFAAADATIQFGAGVRLGWPLLLKRFPVVTSHQIWHANGSSKRSLKSALRCEMLRRSLNVCCSDALAQRLGAPSHVICNPFNEHVFCDAHRVRDRDIVFVGRLIPEKGADLLLESLVRLREHRFRLSATLVGDGPQRDELQRQATAYGLQEQVEFAGTVAAEALGKLLNRHRVLVIPSRWEEPFGIVALEGLACGCAVVASNGGGLPEAVGLWGHLFTRGNIEEMTQRIMEALHRPEQARGTCASHLSRFTSATIAAQYLTLVRRHFQRQPG